MPSICVCANTHDGTRNTVGVDYSVCTRAAPVHAELRLVGGVVLAPNAVEVDTVLQEHGSVQIVIAHYQVHFRGLKTGHRGNGGGGGCPSQSVLDVDCIETPST